VLNRLSSIEVNIIIYTVTFVEQVIHTTADTAIVDCVAVAIILRGFTSVPDNHTFE